MKYLFPAVGLAVTVTFASTQTAVAQATSNWYLGAGVGITNADQCDEVSISACDDRSVGGKFFVGKSASNFGFEAGFSHHGSTEYSQSINAGGISGNVDLDASMWSFYGAAMVNFRPSEHFTLFGKLGGHVFRSALDYDASAASLLASVSLTGTATDVGFGLYASGGIEWLFNDHHGLRLEVETFRATPEVTINTVTTKGAYNVLSGTLAYVYRF